MAKIESIIEVQEKYDLKKWPHLTKEKIEKMCRSAIKSVKMDKDKRPCVYVRMTDEKLTKRKEVYTYTANVHVIYADDAEKHIREYCQRTHEPRSKLDNKTVIAQGLNPDNTYRDYTYKFLRKIAKRHSLKD